MKKIICFFLSFLMLSGQLSLWAYPYDGYDYSGISRVKRLEMIHAEELKGKTGPAGQHLLMEDIVLNLADGRAMEDLPPIDPILQEALESIIPNRQKNYSVAVLDITPGRDIRYAAQKADRGYQPGSVGKLAILTGMFCELQNIFPEDFEQRIELLKTKRVSARDWAMSDHHTVPFFDTASHKYYKRTVRESDVFSLFEWLDHMVSVSNNGAASVLWRETILMREFGDKYPLISDEDAETFFKNADRSRMTDVAMSVVNEPLRNMGITEDEWRLGSLFTRGGKRRVRGEGGSRATPEGLMKWMIALESGHLIDRESSLEMKRLMYVTDRRIRYAATNELDSAAVYFKSGSFYKCNRETMPDCGKYKGNVYNYMNSIAIVEQPDGTTYLVAHWS
ncbi:MAG: hypothetical protein AAFO94_06975 [Bacteroidota bacterium]